jgi:hypothetical protein
MKSLKYFWTAFSLAWLLACVGSAAERPSIESRVDALFAEWDKAGRPAAHSAVGSARRHNGAIA